MNHYILSKYKDGGRGEVQDGFPQYDCWGLVRSVRCSMYGLPLMPEWGLVDPENKREVTQAWQEAQTLLSPCKSSLGAIACVFHGRVLLHVGVVVQGRTQACVLDTTPRCGPRLQSLDDFEHEHNRHRMRVEYYT